MLVVGRGWLTVLMFVALQTELVKTKFMDAIQNYQRIESESRQKYKNRVERQYKIGAYMVAAPVLRRGR